MQQNMTINGKSAVCAVIGDPVEHTLSPQIHNTLAGLCGINLAYVPFHVENGRVKEAVFGADALNILGMNVTVPHKSAVIPYLREVDREAALIGAVNTLVRIRGQQSGNGQSGSVRGDAGQCGCGSETPRQEYVVHGAAYRGYNTDLPGLYRAMQSEGILIENETILLLGAGGAARAAAFLCALRGAASVWLLNRSIEKAQQVAEEVNRAAGRECIHPIKLEDWKQIPEGKYLAIQGTSVGLAPNTEEAVIMASDFYRRIHTGFDLVYRPADTKFMRLVREAGGKAYNGLKMLLYQGIEAFELWNGVSVTKEQAMVCYERIRKELEGGNA